MYSEGIGGDHDHHGNVEGQKAEIGENWYFHNYSWRMLHLPKMRKVSLFISQVTVSGMRFCMSNKARTWWWWSTPVENFQIHESFPMARISFWGKMFVVLLVSGRPAACRGPMWELPENVFFFSLDVTHAFPFRVFLRPTLTKKPTLRTNWRTCFYFNFYHLFLSKKFHHSSSQNLEKLI